MVFALSNNTQDICIEAIGVSKVINYSLAHSWFTILVCMCLL